LEVGRPPAVYTVTKYIETSTEPALSTHIHNGVRLSGQYTVVATQEKKYK
jgi:hypothetical protein